jgi:hypothetical protein
MLKNQRFKIKPRTGHPRNSIFPGGDPPVPDQVTGVQITGTTSTSVSASWNPANNATSYNAYVNDSLHTGGIASTNATLGGLAGDTTFQISVAGQNSTGEGLKSSIISATTAAVTQPSGDFSLLGNPSFNANNLTSTQKMWYDRFWAAVNREKTGSSPDYDATTAAHSDNTYTYARDLHEYIDGLLFAFRAVRDLKILDEVDRLTQIMRSKLYDGWIGTYAGYTDGYQNWRYRRDQNNRYGTDADEANEVSTYALIAMVAYAFHLNRGVGSPGGVNYNERANFWTDHLLNHFEPKWRACVTLPNGDSRNCEPTALDFLWRLTGNSGGHTRMAVIKYYLFRGLLTNNSAYKDVANTGGDGLQHWLNTSRTWTSSNSGGRAGGYQNVSTPLGTGVLWSRARPLTTSSAGRNFHPATYFRRHIAHISEMHLEGLWPQDIMQKVGTTMAHFFMDTYPVSGSTPFASSIGGDAVYDSGGLYYAVDTSFDRTTTHRFLISSYAQVYPFMTDGTARSRFGDVMMQTYQLRYGGDPNNPRNHTIPAVMLLDTVKRGV